jgi:hypothetical protein
LQVSGQLAGIEAALAEQCKNISQIKGILAELLYLKGFEEVRAILTTFQSGRSSPPLPFNAKTLCREGFLLLPCNN